MRDLYPNHKRLQKLEASYALRTSLKVHDEREDVSSSVFLFILWKIIFHSNLSKKCIMGRKKSNPREKAMNSDLA